MNQYTVHLFREMRLSFSGIEADTPEAAAWVARERPTEEADNIEDCQGETLAALIDLTGDEDHSESITIDFERERIRKGAGDLLKALRAILPYAENEAVSLENLKDQPETEVEADIAWREIETARSLLTWGDTPDIATADIDIHAVLAARQEIAVVWGIEDVLSLRPDLDEKQAWDVLKAAWLGYDATLGINWDVLCCHAEMLYGSGPDGDDADEEA